MDIKSNIQLDKEDHKGYMCHVIGLLNSVPELQADDKLNTRNEIINSIESSVEHLANRAFHEGIAFERSRKR
jgi:hypothetical protein